MKKRSTYLIIFIFTVFLTQNAFSQTVDIEQEKADLIKADKEWAHAANTNDMEKLWSFWDDKAIMLLSKDFILNGKKSIKEFTINVRKDPNFEINWEVTGAGVSPSAEMGYTYGIGIVKRTGENGEIITDSQPYLVVWVKNPDGKWMGIIEK